MVSSSALSRMKEASRAGSLTGQTVDKAHPGFPVGQADVVKKNLPLRRGHEIPFRHGDEVRIPQHGPDLLGRGRTPERQSITQTAGISRICGEHRHAEACALRDQKIQLFFQAPLEDIRDGIRKIVVRADVS